MADARDVPRVFRALAWARCGAGVTLREIVLATSLARELETDRPRVQGLADRLGLDLDDIRKESTATAIAAPVQLGLALQGEAGPGTPCTGLQIRGRASNRATSADGFARRPGRSRPAPGDTLLMSRQIGCGGVPVTLRWIDPDGRRRKVKRPLPM